MHLAGKNFLRPLFHMTFHSSAIIFILTFPDENDVLKKCDLRMLVSNAEAAECASPYVLTSEMSNTILSFKNCRLFDVSSCNRYLAVANSAYLM